MRLARDAIFFFAAGACFAAFVIFLGLEGTQLNKFLMLSESSTTTNVHSNHSKTDKLLCERNERPHSNGTLHKITFIPFPHKTLGSGMDVACNWTTRTVVDGCLKQDSNFGRVAGATLDNIQVASFQEGVCIPENKTLRSSLHVFSTAEAIECLSPSAQNHSISVFIAGDSYNMQLFIGLADILLGNASNVELYSGKNRLPELTQRGNALKSRRQKDPSFPDVAFVCSLECYGQKMPLSNHCSGCINALTAKSPHVAAVVGAAVHILRRKGRDIDGTVNEIEAFLTESNQVTYNSMPSYQRSKIPLKYRNASHHTGAEAFYLRTLAHVAPQVENRPFIDFFQLTRSCVWDNCSFDGGHRSRYVNRWKAQLLLNTICEYEEVGGTKEG